jgi:hypothetical protein
MRILDEWSRYREKKKRERLDAAAMVELIERMVQDSDPSIRNVAGYQQLLQKPVAHALGYIEGLVSSITGPFNLSAEAWDKEPLIHALFVSPDEIRSLLQDCAELKTFFQHSGSPTAVVLLTATKKERTIFGTALEGDIIKRDVPQVAVEFYDHQVVTPVATEGENRRELIHRGLALLATQTLEEILRIHSLREELSSERRMLAVKLKIRHSRERGLERLLTVGVKRNEDEGQALQLLEAIDHQLQELEPGSETPQDFLHKLEEVLLNPGGVLMGKTLQMRLNWMGVKLSAESTENVPEIKLFELEIPGRAQRVAVLANVSRDDWPN